MNPSTLVAVHGYAGDRQQMVELMPCYEHHQCPIVFLSPTDSQVHGMGPHICLTAGKRAYIGQLSWDRQQEQLEKLLQYPFDWFLLNDSDSIVLTPELPSYLYEDPNTMYSNEVDDFRKPGETWPGVDHPWPMDYHAGFPLIAMQPPYFISKAALTKIVNASRGLEACPITPFIDWWWIPACHAAGVNHKRFRTGASCETVTEHGIAVMSQCVREHGATFIHAIKSGKIMRHMQNLYNQRNGS